MYTVRFMLLVTFTAALIVLILTSRIVSCIVAGTVIWLILGIANQVVHKRKYESSDPTQDPEGN